MKEFWIAKPLYMYVVRHKYIGTAKRNDCLQMTSQNRNESKLQALISCKLRNIFFLKNDQHDQWNVLNLWHTISVWKTTWTRWNRIPFDPSPAGPLNFSLSTWGVCTTPQDKKIDTIVFVSWRLKEGQNLTPGQGHGQGHGQKLNTSCCMSVNVSWQEERIHTNSTSLSHFACKLLAKNVGEFGWPQMTFRGVSDKKLSSSINRAPLGGRFCPLSNIRDNFKTT